MSCAFFDDLCPAVLKDYLSCVVWQVSPDLLQCLVVIDDGLVLIFNFKDLLGLAEVGLYACGELLQDIAIRQPYDLVIGFRVGH